jgi:GrpB-like predicted nucleotidyltransferase (UPF0157 family)
VAPVRIRPEAEGRAAAHAAYALHRRNVLAALPDAEVEHVGSTAVPGALTKGDMDLLVRVRPERFKAATSKLQGLYAIHQPDNWTESYSSFVDPTAANPPVGIQLVISGSPSDVLAQFRDALTWDCALLASYNALKQSLDGEDYERYTNIKGAFIERALHQLGLRENSAAPKTVRARSPAGPSNSAY